MMRSLHPGGLDLTKKAADHIGLVAGMRVLDIGCGDGATMRFLAEAYGADVRGTDVVAGTAAYIRQAGEMGLWRRIEAGSIPWEAVSFDAVFLECVLSLTDLPEYMLCEAARVLKTDGHLVISDLCAVRRRQTALVFDGCVGFATLEDWLTSRHFVICQSSDESERLVQMLADVIFSGGTLEAFLHAEEHRLDGCILQRSAGNAACGYRLLIARKTAETSLGGQFS